MKSGWRLLLTRPAEDCASSAAQLAEHGVHVSCMPLLEIQALEESAEQHRLLRELNRYHAVIVISKPAARIGLARLASHGTAVPESLRWFSVGAATGALLRDQGLDACWPQTGDDSEALLAMPQLAEVLAQAEPRILILRGEGGRELLAERLRERGAHVDYLPLYRRALPEYPAGALPERVRSERLNGLVVSSGQGLEHLRLLAEQAWPQLAELPLFVPSPRVAELAREAGARIVVDCRGAQVAALLAALEDRPAP
ncbi:uroporphyrinogen-III synthase [Pseudomonas kuykendallii]|uniref:Uroporphyrinogen-III synthase n=1 Tax=Pseudomonas kuykendallii TaxID=1007099 RepID=A0A2W5ESB6_9PSED|nr:uroporphyrinogen-III synthase [Pseudomonas kuykendallii]PZP21742.1 MAG: uroporphyrinogen-III synthase [Pseudomonas kuykendallii]